MRLDEPPAARQTLRLRSLGAAPEPLQIGDLPAILALIRLRAIEAPSRVSTEVKACVRRRDADRFIEGGTVDRIGVPSN